MENLVQYGVGHCGLRERVTMLSVAGVTRLSSDAYDWQREKGRRVIPHSAPTDQHAHVGIPSSLRVSEYPLPDGEWCTGVLISSGHPPHMFTYVQIKCGLPDVSTTVIAHQHALSCRGRNIPTIAHYSGQ